jgi:hypothetical protein
MSSNQRQLITAAAASIGFALMLAPAHGIEIEKGKGATSAGGGRGNIAKSTGQSINADQPLQKPPRRGTRPAPQNESGGGQPAGRRH